MLFKNFKRWDSVSGQEVLHHQEIIWKESAENYKSRIEKLEADALARGEPHLKAIKSYYDNTWKGKMMDGSQDHAERLRLYQGIFDCLLCCFFYFYFPLMILLVYSSNPCYLREGGPYHPSKTAYLYRGSIVSNP